MVAIRARERRKNRFKKNYNVAKSVKSFKWQVWI